MRKWLLFVVSMGFCFVASAQQSYYLYFQSENDFPFYVRMGEQVLNSGGAGYIVVPNLSDSTYIIRVGLPGEISGEEKFEVALNSSDLGFAILQSATGVSLQNLAKGTTLLPLSNGMASNIRYEARTDAFTTMLAKASGDPSLLRVAIIETPPAVQPAVVKQEPVTLPETQTAKDTVVTTYTVTTIPADSLSVADVQKDSVNKITDPATVVVENVKPASDSGAIVSTGRNDSIGKIAITIVDSISTAKTDTVSGASQTPAATTTVSIPLIDSTTATDTTLTKVATEEVWVRSTVKRYAESSTSEGFGLVFIDDDGGVKDTIRLIIPNPRIIFQQKDSTEDNQLFLQLKKDSAAVPPVVTNTSSEDSVYIVVAPIVAPRKAMSNCRTVAAKSDFLKLRKNMAARQNDDDMVREGQKAFRSKCYTTEQVKNLSTLFLSDTGKYRFFETAFGHVSDPALFASLGAELKDAHYINRFKLLSGE
jgi:hypothetical protein